MKRPYKLTHQQQGFTILELMVATAVFAVVMLVLAAGVISFSNSYFSSVTRSRTQQVARAIVDDISQGIQFAGKVNPTLVNGTTRGICVDNTRYMYRIGVQADATHFGMVKERGTTDCTTGWNPTMPGSLSNVQNQLLGDNMRLGVMDVSSTSDPYTYDIHVKVIYGDDDQLTGVIGNNYTNAACRNQEGSQFCAISDLRTTVQQRLKK